jgi:hypothetical protein
MGVSAARASLRWQRPRLPPMRPSGGVFAVLGNRRFLNLSGGNPADHDGGADYVGGSLLAFRGLLASSSLLFSAAQYSASDGNLSKSGLYPFASYLDRGIGMLQPVP